MLTIPGITFSCAPCSRLCSLEEQYFKCGIFWGYDTAQRHTSNSEAPVLAGGVPVFLRGSQFSGASELKEGLVSKCKFIWSHSKWSIVRHRRTVHGEQGGSNSFARHAISPWNKSKTVLPWEISFWRKARVCLRGVPIYYNDKGLLKNHIRRMLVVRGVGWMCVEGACEKKPKTFVNNRLLLQHKKDHQNLPCQICSKTFTSKRSLNRHRKQVHKP